MHLVVVGISHKTAPLELRERLAISRDDLPEATRALAAVPGVSECVILSTCNRVELLAAVDSPSTDLTGFLHSFFRLDPALLAPHLYEHRDREAVQHLFRVAASLDSMVVGEPQILGQVKDAYAVARASGTVAGQLEHLLQSAFAAAKKVRSETEIGSNSVSIASVAVELARKIFGSLQGRTVFLVGAGKMSELAARHLVQQGAGTILVTNRTLARARSMAEPFKGRVIPFESIYDAASEADIVLMGNALADVAILVAVGQSEPRAGRSIPARRQIVDHVLLPVVVVGQRAIDAVWQRTGSRGQRAGVVDGLVARSTGRRQRDLRRNDRVAWLVNAGVSRLIGKAHCRSRPPHDAVVRTDDRALRRGAAARPDNRAN